jgi:hypothetical protein
MRNHPKHVLQMESNMLTSGWSNCCLCFQMHLAVRCCRDGKFVRCNLDVKTSLKICTKNYKIKLILGKNLINLASELKNVLLLTIAA